MESSVTNASPAANFGSRASRNWQTGHRASGREAGIFVPHRGQLETVSPGPVTALVPGSLVGSMEPSFIAGPLLRPERRKVRGFPVRSLLDQLPCGRFPLAR